MLTPLFTLPAQTHALSDTPVYRRLAALTAQWRERAPEARQKTPPADETAGAAASHPGARLRLPSKVHVLRVLWDGHTTQSAPHAALWLHLRALRRSRRLPLPQALSNLTPGIVEGLLQSSCTTPFA